MNTRSTLCAAILIIVAAATITAAADKILFEIGKSDNNTAEFALGPNRSNQYATDFPRDALYIAGGSDAKKDFPYIHPGPADIWAGAKTHTFTILFGLKSAPDRGTCRLALDFLDTHSTRPPLLKIRINDTLFETQLPKGAGDPSAFGEIEKGREHIETIEFPASALESGTNSITIENSAGSWILYDFVCLTTPDTVQSGPLTQSDKILDISTRPFLVRDRTGQLRQPILASVLHMGDPIKAQVTVNGETTGQTLDSGYRTLEALAPAVVKPTEVEVEIAVAGRPLAARTVRIEPVKKWEIYILHHSHVDIGYTHVQTDVIKKHFEYFEQVIQLAQESADYPEGSRFKWNAEVLWAVEHYLDQATPEKRRRFIAAVKKGWIGLDALYGNELTALCRPAELIRLVDYAKKLTHKYGLEIDSAMITDVPGYTWGLIPVLAHSNVKYFCVGPNRSHRIGYTLSQWGDKPFYWQSPSGKDKVLTWFAGEGYSLFHAGRLNEGTLFKYLEHLEAADYPYDMLQVRYSIGGDNGPPDPELADYVRKWNEKYAYPKLVIATTSDMFEEFEARYGSKLPTFAGDFTPYWEDGAASSARETAINRAAADRLSQAEALYAMLAPNDYPADRFYKAWRNAILYDEHTWGAYNSISEPENDFVKSQWKIKQAFALDAEAQSKKLLTDALANCKTDSETVTAFDVINTTAWPRSELVVLPEQWNLAANHVYDAENTASVPTIHLSDKTVACLVRDIPPFGAKRFTLKPPTKADYPVPRPPVADPPKLSSPTIALEVDQKTGAITSLKYTGIPVDLAKGDPALGLNEYLYVEGRDPKSPKLVDTVKITARNDRAAASLIIESTAPGAHKLTREIRLTAGPARIDVTDTIDKKNIYDQEAVHIAFPFNVPDGIVRMDTPFATVRPEVDQLPGACKNYFTVQRYVNISNKDYGVLWLTPDAPLIEIGRITNDPRSPVGWIKNLEPSTTIYSYPMNNYWETNYKASQSGPTTFRYSIIPYTRKNTEPHRIPQLAAQVSRPLILVPVTQDAPPCESLLSIDPPHVIATTLRPSDHGKAILLTLYNPTEQTRTITLNWRTRPARAQIVNLREQPLAPFQNPVTMSPHRIITIKAQIQN